MPEASRVSRSGSQPAPVRIAVDAFGGDNAPGAVVRGALAAIGDGLDVILVGRSGELRRLVGEHVAGVEIVEAPDVIAAGEEAARSVRSRQESSLVVACKLVADGRADAFVSAGNTGAVVAASVLYIRRIKGVLRPGICQTLPAQPRPVVFLDAGATAEVRSEHLRQFAIMGQAFAAAVGGVSAPSVGLLSIGEEPSKGTAGVIAAHALLDADPGINFFGNVEGRDLMNHKADVVVTDGFTGNVALKVTEGAARAIFVALRAAMTSSLRARLGALLLRPALRGLRDRLDPEAYGGAYLLGLNHTVVIAHGSSGERGITNAILTAADAVRGGLVETISGRLGGDRQTSVAPTDEVS